LEREFPERVKAEPELLAQHFTEAGDSTSAITYWLRAGIRAAERSADHEAVQHLRRGLDLLLRLPESPERDSRELEFQFTLASSLVAVTGWASPEVGAGRVRSAELSERLGHTQYLVYALYGQFAFSVNRGKTRLGFEAASRCRSLCNDAKTKVIGCRALGVALMQLGQLQDARAELEQLHALNNSDAPQGLARALIVDPFASGDSLLALTLWALGYPAQAKIAGQRAMDIAARLDHLLTTCFALFFAGAELRRIVR
jgi:predicted ATPase